MAVTSAMGTPIRWNEIGRGLELLRAQQEVSYVGLTGPLQFDRTGKSLVADMRFWVIRQHIFQELQVGDAGAAAPVGDAGAERLTRLRTIESAWRRRRNHRIALGLIREIQPVRCLG